jgi:tousled-like kinase
VIFFEMLFGKRPFGHGRTQSDILDENIISKAKNVDFPPSPKKYKISEECKNFIK